MADSRVSAAVRDLENRLGTTGRVLLRPSGTEPVLRVMVEGEDASVVEQHTQALAQRVGEIFASMPSATTSD
jgi:phosphoglucosamine mutase